MGDGALSILQVDFAATEMMFQFANSIQSSPYDKNTNGTVFRPSENHSKAF